MAKENGDKPQRRMATYHIFTSDDEGKLSPLATHEARNAEDAVNVFLSNGGEVGDKPYVIVPERNMTRVTVRVENVQKVRLSTA